MHLQREGCPSVRLFAKLAIVVQDGAAHKELWSCRDGTRLCMSCLTVTDESEISAYDPTIKCCSQVVTEAAVPFTSDEDVKSAARRLCYWKDKEGPTAFTRRQQMMGMTYMQHNLLTMMHLDSIIHPCSQFMHDWMHGLFSSGVFNLVFNLLLCTLEDRGKKQLYPLLEEYVSHWNWPRRLGPNPCGTIFDSSRREGNRKACKFRCEASEGLSVYPVLAYWVSAVVKMLIAGGSALVGCFHCIC